MKNTLKKLLCILLASIMLASLPAFSFAEENDVSATGTDADEPTEVTGELSDEPIGAPLPIVYIGGRQDYIFSDGKDAESETYLTASLPEGAAREIIDAAGKELFNGLLKNDWDAFCNILYDSVSEYFKPIALDERGNVTNTTGYDCLKPETLEDEAYEGLYGIHDYDFIYDWRLDPCANAVELASYIKAVKAATGVDKVNIVASGMGYSTLLAYLAQNGGENIDGCILYGAGLTGSDTAGVLFSGEMQIDDDALNRYIQENLSDTDIVLGLSQYAADLVISNGFADSLFNLTTRIYKQIYTKVLPRILMDSFGTMPGYWSLVGDEYYEKAKEINFPASEEASEDIGTEEEPVDYSVLIKKLDYFHYNVLNKAKALLDGAVKDGVKLYNVVKYGLQVMPLSVNADETSDGINVIGSSSLGATAAPIGTKLDEAYIAAKKETPSGKFLSPDGEVDASTGYLPMHTWYIKNLHHESEPYIVDIMLEKIFAGDGYVTVFDSEEYAQFLVCSRDADRMENLTETGVITPTVKDELEELISFNSPTGIIKKLFSMIAGIVELMRYFIDLFTTGEIFA